MSQFLIAQYIGVVAVLLSLSIFQVNKRNKMLKLSVTATCLYAIHFLLLGAYTGSAMNIVGGLRSYTFINVKPNKAHRWVLTLFIALATVGTLLTWHGFVSLLPLGGAISATFAMWHSHPKNIRRWALIAPPLWFTYNVIVGSYPGMFIEVIMLTSNLVGEYRYDMKKTISFKHG